MHDPVHQRQSRFNPSGRVGSSLPRVLAAIVLLLPLILPVTARGDFDSSPQNGQPQQPAADEAKTPPKKPAGAPQSAGTGKGAATAKATKSGSGDRPKKKK